MKEFNEHSSLVPSQSLEFGPAPPLGIVRSTPDEYPDATPTPAPIVASEQRRASVGREASADEVGPGTSVESVHNATPQMAAGAMEQPEFRETSMGEETTEKGIPLVAMVPEGSRPENDTALQGDPEVSEVGYTTAEVSAPMPVPEELKSWDTPWPEYNPPALTTEWVKTTGVELRVSDPETPSQVDFSQRPSFLGEYAFDDNGRPLNPMGRQGIADRGDLAKWGPNNAADPIVIASDAETGNDRILLIRRRDTGQWALPGGMVDPGEHVSVTATRELGEEAGIDLRQQPNEVVYEGYVRDPRNTDNSWIETAARLIRIDHTPEAAAGDDAADARWFGCNSLDQLRQEIRTLDRLEPEAEPLYASHSDIIAQALQRVHQPDSVNQHETNNS